MFISSTQLLSSCAAGGPSLPLSLFASPRPCLQRRIANASAGTLRQIAQDGRDLRDGDAGDVRDRAGLARAAHLPAVREPKRPGLEPQRPAVPERRAHLRDPRAHAARRGPALRQRRQRGAGGNIEDAQRPSAGNGECSFP